MTVRYLITGGTGSFGAQMVKHLHDTTDGIIRVFSRDELKQDLLRRELNSSRLELFLGDVRDSQAVRPAVDGVDFIFHAAALKQVPAGEFFPMEYVKTNIFGTQNVLEAAFSAGVEKVVCLSTDKAVQPINSMGISKALMEKIAISFARQNTKSKTRVAVTRYGNVLMSRGSVVPLFLDQILQNKPLTITNPAMTRFVMTLSESVKLVKHAFEEPDSGNIYVMKSPSATVEDLAKAVARIRGIDETRLKVIGTRHAEKLYEALLSPEELARAISYDDYFTVPMDARNLNYESYFDLGEELNLETGGYHSSNSRRLSVDELVAILSPLILGN